MLRHLCRTIPTVSKRVGLGALSKQSKENDHGGSQGGRQNRRAAETAIDRVPACDRKATLEVWFALQHWEIKLLRHRTKRKLYSLFMLSGRENLWLQLSAKQHGSHKSRIRVRPTQCPQRRA